MKNARFSRLGLSRWMLLLAIIGMAGGLGIWWGQRSTRLPMDWQSVLHADSAAGGKAVSAATGRLDEETECLFVLDHLTGNLSCLIINPRNAQAGGAYMTNVTSALQLDKVGELDFVMVTGFNAFGLGGRTNNLKPANCLCYVIEGNSGKAVAYSLSYNRTAMQQGALQQGALELVWQGSFRADNLRR